MPMSNIVKRAGKLPRSKTIKEYLRDNKKKGLKGTIATKKYGKKKK